MIKQTLLALALLVPGTTVAQGMAAIDCRANVADALGIGTGSISTSMNGNVVEWETILGGRRVRGFCETDRSGRVSSTQLGPYRGGGFGNNNNNNGGGNNGGSIFGPGGGGNKGGANQGGGAIIPINANTAGRGTLEAMGQSVRLSRGWVDTRNEPSIALSGSGDFKITLFGVVTGSSGDREFTMRITRSDRGNANGTATVRVNGDRNEVETIRVDGRVNGSPFNGTFSRN